MAGINEWPGKQMHSHNYRDPEPFRDKVCATFASQKMYAPLLNVNSKLSLADDLKNNNNNYTAVVN